MKKLVIATLIATGLGNLSLADEFEIDLVQSSRHLITEDALFYQPLHQIEAQVFVWTKPTYRVTHWQPYPGPQGQSMVQVGIELVPQGFGNRPYAVTRFEQLREQATTQVPTWQDLEFRLAPLQFKAMDCTVDESFGALEGVTVITDSNGGHLPRSPHWGSPEPDPDAYCQVQIAIDEDLHRQQLNELFNSRELVDYESGYISVVSQSIVSIDYMSLIQYLTPASGQNQPMALFRSQMLTMFAMGKHLSSDHITALTEGDLKESFSVFQNTADALFYKTDEGFQLRRLSELEEFDKEYFINSPGRFYF